MLPAVELQDLLVVAGKLAGLLGLPEDARTGAQKRVVEQPLVVRARPPALVERLQGLAARRHAVEPRRRVPGHPRAPLLERRHEHRRLVVIRKVRVVLGVDVLEHAMETLRAARVGGLALEK